jgi:F0F1-type ATP synthase delta subunit
VAPSAAKAATPSAGELKLPVLVFGVVEVRRLKRELEALEEYMEQAATREPGKQIALPRVSRLLDALATDNRLNLLQPEHRKQMKAFLVDTERHAPTIHISFATDPSSAFTVKIVTWLRTSIAPNVLLEVGLQPTIAAGCIVRTTNKIFDLSLRQHFADAESVLLEALEHEAANIAPAASPAVSVAPQAATAPAQPVASPVPVAATPAPQVAAPAQPAPVAQGAAQ